MASDFCSTLFIWLIFCPIKLCQSYWVKQQIVYKNLITMPANSNRIKNFHLLWRAGFGPDITSLKAYDETSPKKLWKRLLKESANQPQQIKVSVNIFDGPLKGYSELAQFEKLTKEQRKAIQEQSRQDLKKLNDAWMKEMVNSDAQLRERMSLFWHGHFACREVNIYFQEQLLQIIRENAIGNFGTLLKAVSKSPAMLQFLNNQQNKKKKPNENFAREVMELFTMGRGNYTEKDIKEAARAFTGWGFKPLGEFEFRENQHDDDEKTILGKTGNYNGDDVLDILLEQKQTAYYITKKLYRYLVNEKVDEARIKKLADIFFNSKYDIKQLLENIFTADWFYDAENIGVKIKSPVEYIVGIRRILSFQLQDDSSLLRVQKALGQILFYPPNVAGWPGGKSWIDSSTLMLRLRIPQLLAANEEVDIKPKPDDDTQMGMMEDAMSLRKQMKGLVKSGLVATIDWTSVNKVFEKTSKENLLSDMSSSLLLTKSKIKEDVLLAFISKDSRESFVKSATIRLMCTPEYQMC